jgi:hypothetical protein
LGSWHSTAELLPLDADAKSIFARSILQEKLGIQWVAPLFYMP